MTPLPKGVIMGQEIESGLGKKLAILAKLKGMTQEQIARECAMSRISVNRFFRQHTEIRAGDLSQMLQTLGINLEQLIDRAIDRQMNGGASSIDDSLMYRGGSLGSQTIGQINSEYNSLPVSLPMGLAV